jgi:hypothetical protein
MKRPKLLRIVATYIIILTMFFVVYDMFIAHVEPEVDLFFLIIVLSNLVLATALFVWADIRGDQIVIKSKPLRTLASCIAVLAVLFGSGAISFNVFIVSLGSGVKLSFVIIVLLNFVQAILLFVWADLRDGNKR